MADLCARSETGVKAEMSESHFSNAVYIGEKRLWAQRLGGGRRKKKVQRTQVPKNATFPKDVVSSHRGVNKGQTDG